MLVKIFSKKIKQHLESELWCIKLLVVWLHLKWQAPYPKFFCFAKNGKILPKNGIFQIFFGQPSRFSQICCKIFLRPFPPPPYIFGRADVWCEPSSLTTAYPSRVPHSKDIQTQKFNFGRIPVSKILLEIVWLWLDNKQLNMDNEIVLLKFLFQSNPSGDCFQCFLNRLHEKCAAPSLTDITPSLNY